MELAQHGLSAVGCSEIDVVVGGLGLGFTASAVLDDPRVASLLVCELLEPVIDWHCTGLLPLGSKLTGDHRCRFTHGDFFAMSASTAGFDPQLQGRKFHAILVDIDHSPHELLDDRSAAFYTREGLKQLAVHLLPGGVFGLWSNSPPEDAFVTRLKDVFIDVSAIPVTFRNPLQNNMFTQTVYLGKVPTVA